MAKDEAKVDRAITAVNPEDATPEARQAVAAKAAERNAPAAHKADAGPTHRFRLTYDGVTEVIEVQNRNKSQAEIEARAIFNDKVCKKKMPPNPRDVKVESL